MDPDFLFVVGSPLDFLQPLDLFRRKSLALQGSFLGLVVHGMQGFNYDKAKEILRIPDEYQVEAMIAVGKEGKKETLPDYLQEREFPKGRKNISEIAMEGSFKK